MVIIGVKFRKSGKLYYFDPIGLPVNKGDHVIVETARGIEYGNVILAPTDMAEEKIVTPLKPIIRLATSEDDAIYAENKVKEKEAFQICLDKIAQHGLEMKLIDSEYTFDRNKLLFYFTADGRIDFRELVKDLAAVFRTRIELRQIGVRDETKLIGGIAICGRPLCCHSYLSEFIPVSIKMAKEQNLSLNPSKISGVCGRLMCCLKNEQEAYEYLNSRLPAIGTQVTTPEGHRGEVQSISVLKQLVKVIITKSNDDKEIREYPVDALSFDAKKRPKGAPVASPLPDEEIDEAELKALARLEEADREDLAEENAGTKTKKSRDRHGQYNHYGKNGRKPYDGSRNQDYSYNSQRSHSKPRTNANYHEDGKGGEKRRSYKNNSHRDRRYDR